MINATKLAIVGLLAAVVTVLGAGVAQAYPDPVVKISLGDARFVGGKTLSYSVDSGGVDCAFTVTFNGKTQTGSGTSFSGTFATPVVSKVTPKTITASCSYDSTGASISAVASDSATVTLLPVGAGNVSSSGVLPDTGGSNLWILVAGGVLVLAGGGAVVASGRRS